MGNVTKIYSIPNVDQSGVCTVVVRHNPMNGSRVIEVDGVEQSKGIKVFDTGVPVQVPLKDGRTATITIKPKLANSFVYTCEVDGVEIKDQLQSQPDRADTADTFTVSIPSASGDPVQFSIAVKVTNQDGYSEWTTTKRYSEFDALRKLVIAAFSKSQLVENIPPLPGKKFKFMQKHDDVDFIEDRRVALESFLQRLILFPHIHVNPDLRAFLAPPGGYESLKPVLRVDANAATHKPKPPLAPLPASAAADSSAAAGSPVPRAVASPVASPVASSSKVASPAAESKNDAPVHHSGAKPAAKVGDNKGVFSFLKSKPVVGGAARANAARDNENDEL